MSAMVITVVTLLLNVIIQVFAGIVGGNAAVAWIRSASLGRTGTAIVGAIGGLGAGQALAAFVPRMAGAAGGGLDIVSIIGQLVSGGAGGAVLTGVIGLVRHAMTRHEI